jgi:flagellar basal body-associated protein FliL
MKKLLGNKKILIGVLVPLIALGVAYKMFLSPKPKPVVKKVDGSLVSVGDPFTVNLAGGHYGRITVALVVDPIALPATAAADAAAAVQLPQNDVIRSIITDALTGVDSARLINRGARHELLAGLIKDLKKSTDEPVKEVLITDLAVQ